MQSRRKSIRLGSDEDQLLRTIHRQSRVPDGQFPQRPKFWREFTETWNAASSRNDSPEEVLHYIVTKRKSGRWFQFDGDYNPLAVPEADVLTPEQWSVVDAIYIEMAVGADNFLFDRDLRGELLRRLIERTGAHIPELFFTAALIARRKGGWLPNIPLASGPDDGIGFGDIDEVA